MEAHSTVQETAQKIASLLAEIRRLSHENEEITAKFKEEALGALNRLNALLKSLKIEERYVDYPFYSKYDDVMRKWESGYRLVLEDSQIKVEEYDEWRSHMYPEMENPIISFAALPAERLADAIEALPEFLRFVADKLNERKEKYRRLLAIVSALERAVED